MVSGADCLCFGVISDKSRHRFKSDKVAEVSYASKFLRLPKEHLSDKPIAIQGKDCLVQKFRNSSVMLEPPHYRPKVSKIHIARRWNGG